jgi:nucleoside-diphosphate-sugar epimerase
MMLLMKSEVEAERFIVVEGNRSYQEVFQEIAKALGVKAPSIEAGSMMTSIAWRWEKLKSIFSEKPVMVTKETARTSLRKSFYNNQKLLQSFPDFHYTPFSETIDRMATAFSEGVVVKK